MSKCLTLAFLIVYATTHAQVNISGKITNTKNKTLAGVSISIKDTYDGATSDSTGNFSFSTDEKGEHTLEVTATGYRPFEQKVNLNGTPIKQNISLKELVTELNAVVITAGTFEASDQKKTTVLSPLDIVTTASANADITGAIKTLPGSQQVGESE